MPPDTDLGEPLAAKNKITFPSRARLRPGKLGLESDLELNECAGGNGLGEAQIDNGLIIFIAVVRGDELQVLGEVALAHNVNAFDVFRTVILRLPFLVSCVAAAHEFRAAYES